MAALRTKAVADRRLARAKAALRRKREAVSVGPNRPLFFWGINFTFSQSLTPSNDFAVKKFIFHVLNDTFGQVKHTYG